MSLLASVLIDSLQLFSTYDSSIEAKFYSSSTKLRSFYNNPLSLNCAKVIMSLDGSWDYILYGMYKTSGRAACASKYVHDVYDNTLENVSINTTSCEETVFCVIGMWTRYHLFCCEIITNIT